MIRLVVSVSHKVLAVVALPQEPKLRATTATAKINNFFIIK